MAAVWRRLGIDYRPQTASRPFLDRAQTQSKDGLEVSVSVLDGPESRKFFGAPLARRSIQPVWIRIVNRQAVPCRLITVSLNANYYTPLEAAAANHFSSGKRLLGFGALAWFFLPFLLVLPLKLWGAWRANRRMDAHFQAQGLRLRPVPPGGEVSGFVFTPLDVGTKVLHPRFAGPGEEKEFIFSIPVPGLDADYSRRELEPAVAETPVECDVPALAQRLAQMPRATTNRAGTREGDPINLVVVGEFVTVLSAFGARWDETETITLATSLKTVRSFLSGAEYRYSPVSGLYLFGRSQDFALQRIRRSINERLHLRLWQTPLRFQGRPVWVGQVSRDIGVRFTWRTWNLTTHRVDPDVDESRDYVVEDLLEAGRIEVAAYVEGVGPCSPEAPRHNLTGDPYFTDGQRAVVLVSGTRTQARFVAWPRVPA